MAIKSYIALNFFPLETQHFDFTIYRRRIPLPRDTRPASCHERRLPVFNIFENYKDAPKEKYWVCFEPKEGFDRFDCTSQTDFHLTEDYLFHLLKINTNSVFPGDYELPEEDDDNFRFAKIRYVLKRHQGARREVVWLEPYYLWSNHEFGFLVDYSLEIPSGERLTKRDLELSLTHKNGRRNYDFYSDRFDKIKTFVDGFHQTLFPLRNGPSPIYVKKTLREIEAGQLEKKTYVFSHNLKATSQFVGMKDHHPLHAAPESGKVFFVYREPDKPLSYDLYRALEGKSFQTFPGMKQMFGYDLYAHTSGIEINGFDKAEIEKLCDHIKRSSDFEHSVPVILIPFEKGSTDYYLLKHTLLKNKVPSQFVRLETLKSESELKWSASNIGLQLFAKLGGQPWKVDPAHQRCLIIGVGQAHKMTPERTIERSFAHTVLTDSSGLYKELKILSSARNGNAYLTELRQNFRRILDEFRDQYEKFVIHLTYKIKKAEIKAIKEVLNEAFAGQNKEFVVMKFNDKNKYFGYSLNNNSFIPYEGSFIQLSRDEYLVWFEGLQNNSTVPKRIERPLHVQFMHPYDMSQENKLKYLQDSVNLSGANWRGFNAKSVPVSIYYAKLVADFVKEFRDLNLEEIDWESLTPWFL
jgi:Piwi domain